MNTALEVVVALCAIYLFLSVVVLALVEMVSALTSLRAKKLEQGLLALLRGKKLETLVFDHPLIKTLGQASGHGRIPSYVPAPFFARAVLDQVARLEATGKDLDAAYKQFLATLDKDSKETLEGVVGTAVTTMEEAQKRVEQWFDAAMDRVSGAFKRRTQAYTRGIALAVVLAVNANTVAIGTTLWTDPVSRSSATAFAAQALEQCEQQNPPADQGTQGTQAPPVRCDAMFEATANQIPLPLGWTWAKWKAQFLSLESFLQALIGFALTIFAVSLGAPFWFDLLRRFAPGIQQTGPKPRKPG